MFQLKNMFCAEAWLGILAPGASNHKGSLFEKLQHLKISHFFTKFPYLAQ
jgi:hypothetical protein